MNSSAVQLLELRHSSERPGTPRSPPLYGSNHSNESARTISSTSENEAPGRVQSESPTRVGSPPESPGSRQSRAEYTETQRPKHGWLSFSRANDAWTYEIANMILSTVCLGVIVGILSGVNGKALLSWTLPIQPNSLISIFAVITKASLVFPMADCASQQKWMLFSGSRPNSLIRFEQFDGASRGPWGSLLLLWHRRLESLPGSILAFLTVLALAIDPFAQQIIHISERTTPDDGASASTFLAPAYNSGLVTYRTTPGEPSTCRTGPELALI
ncbi:uncharacterized protein E0L32_005964 [Thyridium curvatum]|uniref:Uncharacterized protein n=1 Tax=Thyridium curvatum TaxID=1093900 RepID=A0A507B0S0_9PEZI|nr:uncharacterized protein E0L32_005964 [Thyridium curvatum]TPX13493.1 hypothetical protein E0L32_005964 [Thyridium curvatum]